MSEFSKAECIGFLQWALPRLHLRWRGFRRVRNQVCKRIRARLLELRLSDLDSYREYLARNEDEWGVLGTLCRISISRFYRDRVVFDYLRDELFPRIAGEALAEGKETIRCWSIGCASGEEPYTLGLLWKWCWEPKFPQLALEITATEADEHLLERARRGCYRESSLRELPGDWIEGSFWRENEERCLKREFRRNVQFSEQDFLRECPEERYEFILCRNLAFTYFDALLQEKSLERISSRLLPGGYLILGKKESLPAGCAAWEPVQPQWGIWSKGPRSERDAPT